MILEFLEGVCELIQNNIQEVFGASLEYKPPELIKNMKNIHYGCDTWSFGCLIHEILLG